MKKNSDITWVINTSLDYAENTSLARITSHLKNERFTSKTRKWLTGPGDKLTVKMSKWRRQMYSTKCLDLGYGARAEFRQNSPLIKLANWGGGPLKTITMYSVGLFTSTLAYQTSLVCITRLTLTTQTSNIVLLPFFLNYMDWYWLYVLCKKRHSGKKLWKKIDSKNFSQHLICCGLLDCSSSLYHLLRILCSI